MANNDDVIKSRPCDNLGVDMERRTRHVLVAPLDEDDVIALLLDDVVHAVSEAAAVLDDDLLARRLRAVDSDEEAVVAGLGAVDGETVSAIDESRFETRSPTQDP